MFTQWNSMKSYAIFDWIWFHEFHDFQLEYFGFGEKFNKMEVEVSASFLIRFLNKRRRITLAEEWVKEWRDRRNKIVYIYPLWENWHWKTSHHTRITCSCTYVTTFEELLQNVAPIITKQDTHMKDVIPPDERLAVRSDVCLVVTIWTWV